MRHGPAGRAIGTAFAFVHPDWYVTAKHVVIEYGEPKDELLVSPSGVGERLRLRLSAQRVSPPRIRKWIGASVRVF